MNSQQPGPFGLALGGPAKFGFQLWLGEFPATSSEHVAPEIRSFRAGRLEDNQCASAVFVKPFSK